MHYFEFNIKSYQAATAHLTNEEDLAYRRLIEMYYDTEQTISIKPNKPTALQSLSRRLRVGIQSLEIVLSEFFVETENGWVHEYCDQVIAQYHAYLEKQKANGSKGGRGHKADAKPNKPTAIPSVSQIKPPASQPTNQQTNKPERGARATRLPEEWVMPSEWGNWALSEKPDWSNEDVLRVAADFRDYWVAKAGRDAAKLDWLATWRKWVRNTNLKRAA